MKNHHRPPLIPWLILSSLTHYEQEFSMSGDCIEEYQQYFQKKGKLKANLWLWGQALGAVPRIIKRNILLGGTMFSNYLKITLRNIRRHRAFSLINIAGLSIGMMISIFILLWVQDELSFDRFHEKSDTIYRIYEQWETEQGLLNPGACTPYPLGPALQEKYPEVLESMHFFVQNRNLVEFQEKKIYEDRFAFADANFFTLFSFPLLNASPATVLKELNSLVISCSTAKKYFGEEDPLGKTLRVNNRQEFIVTGIMEDMPHNSHIQADFIGNFEYLIADGWTKRWVDHQYYTYLRLRPDADIDSFGARIKTFINDNQKDPTTIHIALQSLKDIHLRTDLNFDMAGSSRGNALYVYIFSLVAVLVLLIACINFMNLATAKAAGRAKEIGIRKVSGASKRNLIKQFMGESIFMSLLAFFFSLAGITVLLPQFNNLTGKSFLLGMVFNGAMLSRFFAVALLTGLLAGSYPAVYLAAFQPAAVLKGTLGIGAKSRYFRRALVMVQFGLSVILLIGTLVISSQLRYMQDKNLGIKRNNILYIELRGKLREDHKAFRDELTQIPEITHLSSASALPSKISWGTTGVDWEGRSPEQRIHWNVLSVDFGFFDSFGLEMTAGRSFSQNFSTDTKTAYIINETGAAALGFDDAVGKMFNLWDVPGSIIGVVRDFHIKSLHEKIEPLIIKVHPSWFSFIFLNIETEHKREVISRLEQAHKDHNPEYPFNYSFLDTEYEALYRSEERMEALFQYFSFFAVFISCLGLFGLSSFMTEQRTKEIGIRKVFGAKVPNILLELLKDFTKWVLYANLIAWPIGYIAMRQWLNNFAYRTDVDWRIFLYTGFGTLVIAVITVSFRSIQAAFANPTASLRYE